MFKASIVFTWMLLCFVGFSWDLTWFGKKMLKEDGRIRGKLDWRNGEKTIRYMNMSFHFSPKLRENQSKFGCKATNPGCSASEQGKEPTKSKTRYDVRLPSRLVSSFSSDQKKPSQPSQLQHWLQAAPGLQWGEGEIVKTTKTGDNTCRSRMHVTVWGAAHFDLKSMHNARAWS